MVTTVPKVAPAAWRQSRRIEKTVAVKKMARILRPLNSGRVC